MTTFHVNGRDHPMDTGAGTPILWTTRKSICTELVILLAALAVKPGDKLPGGGHTDQQVVEEQLGL